MKTVIIYATKHGFAKKCSEKLSEKLNGQVELCNLKENKPVELPQYDKVIIGGSIYMGQIQKEVREFCLKNQDELNKKKLGLFICCMSEEDKAKEQLNNSFSQEMINNAIVKGNFGGEFAFRKMNFFERFIIKKVSKTSEDMSNFKEENVDKFAHEMNSIMGCKK